MAERKVLNKYYPSDFDPDKLRTIEKKNTKKICNVRMMLPMTMKCYTCGTYTYIGTKCNMKVEPVEDEDYLGITLYRFYYRCSNCFSQITFKTDPKNNDYTAEIGASRNHQPWKDIMLAEEEYKNNKKKEMKDDAMKNLEYRTYDSKREMDILEATDKVKELNRREANIDFNGLIKKIREYHDKEKEKLENNILNNETIKDKDKEKQILNEKKEIEKMFKYIKNKKKEENKDNKDDNKDILDKLIKGIDIKNNKTNKNKEKDRENKEKSLKEKIENNFFLKKKLEREEKIMEKNRNNQFSNFLDEKDEENSENSNSEDKRKINDIFKKPLINFSKLKKKK
jgi:hypothetical protein